MSRYRDFLNSWDRTLGPGVYSIARYKQRDEKTQDVIATTVGEVHRDKHLLQKYAAGFALAAALAIVGDVTHNDGVTELGIAAGMVACGAANADASRELEIRLAAAKIKPTN